MFDSGIETMSPPEFVSRSGRRALSVASNEFKNTVRYSGHEACANAQRRLGSEPDARFGRTK